MLARLFLLPFLFLAGSLTGCVFFSEPLNVNAYRYGISFTGNTPHTVTDATLRLLTQRNDPPLYEASSLDHAHFIAQTSFTTSPLASASGTHLSVLGARLQQTDLSVRHTLTYTLQNNLGTVLTAGPLTQDDVAPHKVLPSFSTLSTLEPTAQASDALAAKLAHALSPYTGHTPWRAVVSAVLDYPHVQLSAGQTARLKILDRLVSETPPDPTLSAPPPPSVLEVVAFTPIPSGGTAAIARVVSGFVPEVGTVLRPLPR